jgi:hypothetical protein
MTGPFELSCFLKNEDQIVPFYLMITEPRHSNGEDDYFCRIHSPALLSKDIDIYGADEIQARELSLGFVEHFLSDKQLLDKDGNILQIGPIKKIGVE